MFNDIQILCYKYQFDSNIELAERNFFNFLTPPILLETLDLTDDYILNIGNIEFSFDLVDSDSSGESYYMTPSEMNFTLGGIINEKYLNNFFELFSDELYVKYQIEVFYKGNSVWRGIINPESFSEAFKPSGDSQQITFSTFGFEKEFAEYFVNKPLENLVSSGVKYDNNLKIYCVDILNAFKALFCPNNNNILFDCEPGLETWKIGLEPTLQRPDALSTIDFKSEYYPYVMLKSGYNNIKELGENKFDWFKKLLTSMGWVFYFDKTTLMIRNRQPINGTLTNLEIEKIRDWKLSKQFMSVGYDYVIIDDGEYYLNNDPEGAYYGKNLYAISNIYDEFLFSVHFRDYYNRSNTDSSLLFRQYDKLFFDYTEDDWYNTIQWGKITRIMAGGKRFVYNFNNTPTYTAVPKKRLLKLNCGSDTSSIDFVKYINNPPLYIWRVHYEKVHYGNCMFKESNNVYTTYQDYVYSQQFRNNMNRYFKDKSIRKITVNYNDLLFDHINSSFELPEINELYGSYSLRTIKFDLLNDRTTLELQQSLNLN